MNLDMEEKKLTDEQTIEDKVWNYEQLKKKLKEYQDKTEQEALKGTLKEEKTCENISGLNAVDGFVCSKCGISLVDYVEERVDEEYNVSYHEYYFKYCPNCGAKVVKE